MVTEMETNGEDDCTFLVRAGRELIEQCGIGDDLRHRTLDPANVPPELHPLISCAEVWNVGDDYYRGDMLNRASSEVLRRLVQTVHKYIEPLNEWLEAQFIEFDQRGGKSTDELYAFVWLRASAVDALSKLRVKFGENHRL